MNTSPDSAWHYATLGLGGNLGDPPAAMAQALRGLEGRADCRVVAVSRLYRTPPWGKTDQADFFNVCAGIETQLLPEELLDLCLGIEQGMKRIRKERWGPRTIDIDVLTYGTVEMHSDTLTLPHPRMLERGFVLLPLADFAGEMAVSGRSVGAWLAAADISGIVVADGDRDWWQTAGM